MKATFGLAGLLLIALAGCRPGDEVDLDGGSWLVASVDGSSMADLQAAVSFRVPDADSATVTTACGSQAFATWIDMDSDSMTFTPAGERVSCPAELVRVEQTLTAALSGVERWKARDEGSIELLGESEVVLKQP